MYIHSGTFLHHPWDCKTVAVVENAHYRECVNLKKQVQQLDITWDVRIVAYTESWPVKRASTVYVKHPYKGVRMSPKKLTFLLIFRAGHNRSVKKN